MKFISSVRDGASYRERFLGYLDSSAANKEGDPSDIMSLPIVTNLGRYRDRWADLDGTNGTFADHSRRASRPSSREIRGANHAEPWNSIGNIDLDITRAAWRAERAVIRTQE